MPIRRNYTRDIAIGVLVVVIGAAAGWVVGAPAHPQTTPLAPGDAEALLNQAMGASETGSAADLNAESKLWQGLFGLAAPDAALVVAGLWMGLKLLDVNKGLFEAFGLWTRKKLVGDLVSPAERGPDA